MNIIQVPVTLYSVPQALVRLRELGLDISDTWLRKRMRAAELEIYRVGRSDFVTETDLYKFIRLPQSKPGPKPKRQKEQ